MIRLLPNPVGKAKTIKYLKTSTLQSVRLAVEDFRTPFIDDPGLDATASSPRGGHEAVKDQSEASQWMNIRTLQAQPQRRADHIASLPSEPRRAAERAKMPRAGCESSSLYRWSGIEARLEERHGPVGSHRWSNGVLSAGLRFSH